MSVYYYVYLSAPPPSTTYSAYNTLPSAALCVSVHEMSCDCMVEYAWHQGIWACPNITLLAFTLHPTHCQCSFCWSYVSTIFSCVCTGAGRGPTSVTQFLVA